MSPKLYGQSYGSLPVHGGFQVDPLLPSPSLPHYLEQLGRNSLTRVTLDQANAWVLPTTHQAKSFPNEFQTNSLHVIHEGIDTNVLDQTLMLISKIRDIIIDRNTPVVTFCEPQS